jgi:hypothetical protein
MKKASRTSAGATMSPDAYAGFLKLWLTPSDTLPSRSPEIDAYLRHVSEREPLSEPCLRALGQITVRAA